MEDITKNVYNLGGNPIYHSYSNFFLNKEEVELLKNTKIDLANKTNAQISNNLYILNNSKLKRIKKFFDEKLKYYTQNVIGIKNEFKMTNSWLSVNSKNSQNQSHKHSNTIFSVIYYVQVRSGNTYFELERSPIQKNFYFEYDIIKKNEYNTNKVVLNIKENDICIFPGWVTHGTFRNESETDRVIIAANYFVNGILGQESKVNNLILNIN